jgi:hypothetical protein
MIEWLLHLPAYIKVASSFAGILLLNRFGVALGVSILTISLILSLWSGTGIPGLLFQAASFKNPDNYLLPLVILLLLFFTEALNVTGRMERTVSALKAWLSSRKMLLSGLPALIGLLPMPAGAIVSAPLVESVDTKDELSPQLKVAINYWFRHIWEYWWPLYPGVILAIKYSGLPVAIFFLIQIPFTVAAIVGGYFFILKKVKMNISADSKSGQFNRDAILSALFPISLLVGISVLGSAIFPFAGVTGTLASLLSMLAGLVIALVITFRGNTAVWGQSLNLFTNRNTWLMMILIIGIQAFSSILQCPLNPHGATLVTIMRDEFMHVGIPLTAVMMLIPFISGLATGVAFGFVGASFPIVFALLGQDPTLGAAAATTACAYAFGYMGMMLSPIHVCYVVTCEYFKTPLLQTYQYIAGPVGVILITSLVLSKLYSLI